MAEPILTPDDLAPFADIEPAQAAAMCADVEAVAVRAAPCLANPDFPYRDAAKAILRRAVLRWNETGASGATTQEASGPFSHAITSSGSRGVFFPSEIKALKDLCKDASGGRAFTIHPGLEGQSGHADICSTVWGGACSCGADLTGGRGPLWETEVGDQL